MSSSLIYLHAGELVVSSRSDIVSTILGSCVSVCLYSPKHKIGGIIHYTMPRRSGKGLDQGKYQGRHQGNAAMQLADDALKYGVNAIPILIEALCNETGQSAEEFVAKIVGGAVTKTKQRQDLNAGPANIEVAKKVLSDYGIKVTGTHVGGPAGRKILFHTDSGRLRVSMLNEPQQKLVTATPILSIVTPTVRVSRPKRVFIVDDSATIRALLTRIFESDPGLEVVGSAADPIEALTKIANAKPDVITLDIHMPKMDGVTFLEKHMVDFALPTVMITSVSEQDSHLVLRALESGAVDYIQKPSMADIRELADVICQKVKAAAFVRLKTSCDISGRYKKNESTQKTNQSIDQNMILAIGASTGGTEALKNVLVRLPANIPPILIVQHIPPVFSTAFCTRLTSLCAFPVKEAADGDRVERGRVLLAPGGFHMEIVQSPQGYKVRVFEAPKVSGHRPSVDVLFASVAKHVGKKAIGTILTGMGADGAEGLLKMHKAGAKTIAQSEKSCVVFGMPKEAIARGAVEAICDLDDVADQLIKFASR